MHGLPASPRGSRAGYWLRAILPALTVVMGLAATHAVAASRSSADTLVIPPGKGVKIDGVARVDEWVDADTVRIEVEPGWVIPVLLKHDGESLYFAFSDLVRGRQERYPEVLLDATGSRSEGWDESDWWLHVSQDECTGRGFYGIYGHTCAQDGEGWYANNFPLATGRIIEIKVALDLVGLRPPRSKAASAFALALAVADSESRSFAAGSPHERRFFWPANASMTPASWAMARLGTVPR